MRTFFGTYPVADCHTVQLGALYSSLYTGEVVRVTHVERDRFIYETYDGRHGSLLFAGVKGVFFRDTDNNIESIAAGCIFSEEEVKIAEKQVITSRQHWKAFDEELQ